jgi:hypothetical protein
MGVGGSQSIVPWFSRDDFGESDGGGVSSVDFLNGCGVRNGEGRLGQRSASCPSPRNGLGGGVRSKNSTHLRKSRYHLQSKVDHCYPF